MEKLRHTGVGQVRISHELSEGEKLGTSNRKVRVKKCLESHGIPCNLDDVPNIAILGAGGGLRAMIALHGILEELQNQGLLDAIMYLCGVSGSTWCMSSLYKNGDWAEKLQALEEHMQDTIAKSTWSLSEATEMLFEASKDENYSLTEFWAYTTVYGMLHELDKGHLSEHRGASENGNNPYPIYAAVDEQRFFKLTEYAPETWFEFTPHEASSLGWGASVPMEYFGSEYENGNLKRKKEEKNMSYLQGLWGSAIGSKYENKNFVKDILTGIFQKEAGSSLSFMETAQCFLNGMVKGFPMPTIDCDIRLLLDFPRILRKTKAQVSDWKWGTNNNFLYKCSAIDSSELVEDKVISLVDAGIAINSAFPLVLRPERKVKLILSFDFGLLQPFKVIKQAAKYCKENCIPFPEVDEKLLQEADNPSDCYIFRGDGAPTVMHFPIFNKVNCLDSVKEWISRFSVVCSVYSEGDINGLLQAARLNVSNNKDKILQEIKHIMARSSEKSSS